MIERLFVHIRWEELRLVAEVGVMCQQFRRVEAAVFRQDILRLVCCPLRGHRAVGLLFSWLCPIATRAFIIISM